MDKAFILIFISLFFLSPFLIGYFIFKKIRKKRENKKETDFEIAERIEWEKGKYSFKEFFGKSKGVKFYFLLALGFAIKGSRSIEEFILNLIEYIVIALICSILDYWIFYRLRFSVPVKRFFKKV